MVYAGLLVGALITLAPFVLGLLTSFTSAHQFATGTPCRCRVRRRCRITATSVALGSAARWP